MKLSVIGNGLIGKAVVNLASRMPALNVIKTVDAWDVVVPKGSTAKLISPGNYAPAIQGYDAVVCCTPYTENIAIATICAQNGVPYFDLTEDITVSDFVKSLPASYPNAALIPQCGLAPGAVSIIAANLARKFDSVETIEIRVGALPLSANNHLKYYLTWSPEGLINEYANPCLEVKDGAQTYVEPLEGLETVVLDGIEYEAFNTSGGIGSFADRVCESLGRNVDSVNYKTMRYKGHRDKIKFLFDDLGLRKNKKVLVDLFRASIPFATTDDVVVIFIEVTGTLDGKRIAKSYVKRIYGDDTMSAIEKTTAGGVLTVVEWYLKYALGKRGVIYNEDIRVSQLAHNMCWKIYQ